jgi:hypothetical protein
MFEETQIDQLEHWLLRNTYENVLLFSTDLKQKHYENHFIYYIQKKTSNYYESFAAFIRRQHIKPTDTVYINLDPKDLRKANIETYLELSTIVNDKFASKGHTNDLIVFKKDLNLLVKKHLDRQTTTKLLLYYTNIRDIHNLEQLISRKYNLSAISHVFIEDAKYTYCIFDLNDIKTIIEEFKEFMRSCEVFNEVSNHYVPLCGVIVSIN